MSAFEKRYVMSTEDLIETYIQEDCYFTFLGEEHLTRHGIHVYRPDGSHVVNLYMGGTSERRIAKYLDMVYPYLKNEI